MGSAIEVQDLRKRFGHVVALDGLDLHVDTAAVHGFLGPNGAGKSTTLRILLGLVRADSGRATILGADPWRDVATLHERLAYVPGDVTLWPNLSGGEAIDLLTRLRGHVDTARRDALVERFALDPRKKGRSYSKGNRQKVALVAALASDVELLLLDEPTSGLDPLMESVFREAVREFSAAGGTVLLSSHILSEVEALCDTVSIIRDGRTIDAGDLEQLRHRSRTTVDATLTAPVDAAQLAGIDGVGDVVADGTHVRFTATTEALSPSLMLLTAKGVRHLASAPPSLEELFLEHYAAPVATRP